MSGQLDVRGVGKAYRQWGSELGRVAAWFGLPTRPKQETWVLRGVSFSVSPGEAVAIVGPNGAGKSTLLKMITGTVRPSEGSIASVGSVAAILELGMGFSPDLSGRQNAYHAAGLLGHTASTVDAVIDDIERFAEVGDYFDQPVRTYSSGMQVRVAFSVATAFRPDLLIIDEALSVGDAYFVHKCFQRIHEFRAAGTSLLFVSHDPAAVQALCDRAILIDAGRVVLDGAPQQVLDYYNALIAEKENSTVRVEFREGRTATESGTGDASIEAVALLDRDGRQVEYVGVGDPVRLQVNVRVNRDVERLVFGYMIRDRLGQPVYGTNTSYTGQVVQQLAAGELLAFDVGFDASLGPGSYSVSLALHDAETHLTNNYQWKDLALVFTVANIDHPTFVGVAHLPGKVRVSRSFGAPA